MELIPEGFSVATPKVSGGDDIIVHSNSGDFVGGQTPKAMTVRVTIDFISSGDCQALVDNPMLILKAVTEQYGTVTFEKILT